jgi:hypothetical protein
VRRALALLALVPSLAAAESFTFNLTFPDGVPGVIRAQADKAGERHTVSCDYLVSQEEMNLRDMPLGSWRGTGIEKADRDAVRALCLSHYEDAVPHD